MPPGPWQDLISLPNKRSPIKKWAPASAGSGGRGRKGTEKERKRRGREYQKVQTSWVAERSSWMASARLPAIRFQVFFRVFMVFYLRNAANFSIFCKGAPGCIQVDWGSSLFAGWILLRPPAKVKGFFHTFFDLSLRPTFSHRTARISAKGLIFRRVMQGILQAAAFLQSGAAFSARKRGETGPPAGPNR